MGKFLDLLSSEKKKKPNRKDNHVSNSKKPMFSVALMFLTYGNINRPEIWHRFLKEQGGKRFRPYIHNKHPFDCSFGFDKFQIPDKIKTKWGHKSLVAATLKLMLEALKDPRNEFFALLSNSCIPIQSPMSILANLEKNGNSRMLYRLSNVSLDKFYTEPNFWGPGPHVFQSQWMLLNKNAANFFVQKNFVSYFFDTTRIILDEHYFANIFLKFNLKFENSASTFVNWAESTEQCHPKTYTEISAEEVKNIKEKNPRAFFMRKISSDTKFHFEEDIWNI